MSFDPNSPNPYAAASSTPPTTPKKSNTLLYVLLGVGGLVLLTCAGCIGLFALGLGQVGKMAAKTQAQMQATPAVQEHIGTITEYEYSIPALAAEIKKNPDRHPGRDACIKVKGDKGEGVIMAKLVPDPTSPRLINAELVLPNGEFHRLAE